MNAYPADWKDIAKRTKDAAGWKCVRCGVPHGPVPCVLTTHHWDGDKANCRWWNLMALCQRCHLSVQARVRPQQVYIFEHKPWCKIFAAGFYAWKYLGQEIDRAEAEIRIEELLALERKA